MPATTDSRFQHMAKTRIQITHRVSFNNLRYESHHTSVRAKAQHSNPPNELEYLNYKLKLIISELHVDFYLYRSFKNNENNRKLTKAIVTEIRAKLKQHKSLTRKKDRVLITLDSFNSNQQQFLNNIENVVTNNNRTSNSPNFTLRSGRTY